MKIGYKEVRSCRMCKKSFVVDKPKCKEKGWPKSYCITCCKKYFNKNKKEE